MTDHIDKIKAAINDLSQCIGIVGAEQECMQKLRDLRFAKTTWVGKEENDIRFVVDRILCGDLGDSHDW